MSNSTVPGMIYPTQKAMIGSNPSDSARLTALNKSASQAQANQLMAGGKMTNKNKKGWRGGNSVVVPQYQMLYQPQGGVGTNPNDQIQGNAQTSTQSAANRVYDAQATKMGGRRHRRRTRTKKHKNIKKYTFKRRHSFRRHAQKHKSK